MATRYSGSLTIYVRLLPDSINYTASIRREGCSISMQRNLRLSADAAGKIAADSAEAYDAIAHSALSFGTSEHGDDVGSFAELDPNTDSWLIRRRK